MAAKPLEIREKFEGDKLAEYIANTWAVYNSNRDKKIEQWKELRNYIFATDTTTTSNKSLPWKNSTTLPKLCQIRDNLHSNYISALFPNDDWLKWEAYSQNDATKEKVEAIESYMSNKTREGDFRQETSRILYDYIDYGNAFATVEYESSYRIDSVGKRQPVFIGPKIKRISPLDIVFNPIASSFMDSFKIVRSVKTIGELRLEAQNMPESSYLRQALMKRDKMMAHMGTYGVEEWHKAEGVQVDGFGNYAEYLQSGYVEILEFYGDLHNQETQEAQTGRVVTVIDRLYVIRNEPIPSWLGHAPIYHVGWRTRSDNLWAMGPLDNLVGMQYRIDHLENLKADAMDLAVLPPLVIYGEVEEFVYGPGKEIHVDEGGKIEELGKNLQWVLAAETAIERLEQRMEMYAGAPREAMGIRTPGEKTAFEVQQLENASGRIFQEKINSFEIQLLEKALNAMLEISRRTMDSEDVIRVMDNDIGVQKFRKISKEDITAAGNLRPIGARHFAAQAQLLQNVTAIFNSNMANAVAPHLSGKNLAKLLEEALNLRRYSLFTPNAAIFEQQETARLSQQAQEDLAVESQTPDPSVAQGGPVQ
jgi:hypothetical protein